MSRAKRLGIRESWDYACQICDKTYHRRHGKILRQRLKRQTRKIVRDETDEKG